MHNVSPEYLKSSNVLEQVVLIHVVKDGILILTKILTKNTKKLKLMV